MPIQPIARDEVDGTTKQRRQFVPHALKSHKTDASIAAKVDQDINITVGSLFASRQRTENRQFPHRMGATKIRKRGG